MIQNQSLIGMKPLKKKMVMHLCFLRRWVRNRGIGVSFTRAPSQLRDGNLGPFQSMSREVLKLTDPLSCPRNAWSGTRTKTCSKLMQSFIVNAITFIWQTETWPRSEIRTGLTRGWSPTEWARSFRANTEIQAGENTKSPGSHCCRFATREVRNIQSHVV